MRDGLELRKIQCTAIIRMYANARPIKGARTMKERAAGHCPTTSPSSARDGPSFKPALAMAAPAYPPINACDELVGRLSHQVRQSQTMRTTSTARITQEVTSSRATKPVPTVLATPVPKVKAETKLKNAAQTTAWNGVSTRVATIVATELAAS